MFANVLAKLVAGLAAGITIFIMQVKITFSDLYFSDSYFAKIINNMVQKSEENPHSIIRNGFEKRLDSFLYKRPIYNESKLKSLNSGKYEIKMLKKLINKTSWKLEENTFKVLLENSTFNIFYL